MNTAAPQRPRVALFVSCLVNVFRPSVAEAAVTLLERAGCEVEVPLEQSCCGQPGYNAGAIAAARPLAQNLIRCFEGYDYVVAPSGSCAGMIKAHYPRLLADMPEWRERAQALAVKTHELTHFLHRVMAYVPSPVTGVASITYHDSCAGLRELGIRAQPRALLAQAGVPVSEMQGTEVCCGFGGAFCAKLPEISAAMADEKLAHAIATGAATMAGGDLGCLLHLAGRASAMGVALEIRHVAEVLAEAEVAGMARSYTPEPVGAGHARDHQSPPPQPGHARAPESAPVGAGHARDHQSPSPQPGHARAPESAPVGAGHAHDHQSPPPQPDHARAPESAPVGAGHARDAALSLALPQTPLTPHVRGGNA